MRRRLALVGISVLLLAPGGLAPRPAAALDRATSSWWRPVPGRVVHPFRAPVTRFGRGHLGVDFAARPGTPVRSAGAGTVIFAGVVAGARHVVVEHPDGLRTSYSFLASVRVRTGQRVRRGEVVGSTGGHGEHHEPDVFHFGLRVAGAYADPMRLFAPADDASDLTTRVHLAPDSDPAESWGRPLHWRRFRTDPAALTQSFARP